MKYYLSVLIALFVANFANAALSGTQTAVSIQGVIKDRYSGEPIKGATVALSKPIGLKGTSKADGSFTLSLRSYNGENGPHYAESVPAVSYGRITFSNDVYGVVTIRISDLDGNEVYYLNEAYDKGVFSVLPGSLPAGTYVVNVTTELSMKTDTFTVQSPLKLSSIDTTESKSYYTRQLDTLTVSAPGYPTTKYAATSITQKNLTLYVAPTVVQDIATARKKLKHLIFIMQENRSFDHYFGTYPGAFGIPSNAYCLKKDNKTKVYAYHNSAPLTINPNHYRTDAIADINGGKMNGFVKNNNDDKQVMGYRTDAEIRNYWQYAQNFVLQDSLFESCISFSQPSHLYMVSGWSASYNSSKKKWEGNIDNPGVGPSGYYEWTDITWLLFHHKPSISWAYYLGHDWDPACPSCDRDCINSAINDNPLDIWNPLPKFQTVSEDNQTLNVISYTMFYGAVSSGTSLPAVCWIIPGAAVSEHPDASFSKECDGQSYVTSLINAVMNNKEVWDSCAIFLSWDDWGGFYDHVNPPKVADGLGYGIRVPGLMISPYAIKGKIDHQRLSHDSYLKFIEDLFLGGQRINAQDGRPDARPTPVRENVIKGDVLKEFDFSKIQPKLVLSCHPAGCN